jgi:hypothetical protein
MKWCNLIRLKFADFYYKIYFIRIVLIYFLKIKLELIFLFEFIVYINQVLKL